MLTQGEDVEVHALARRGWSVSAIARHLGQSALFDEVVPLGYRLSYVSFARQLRLAGLRPHCEACSGGSGRDTIEIAHPAGAEMQGDWFQRRNAPWGGTAYVLLGPPPHSSRVRRVVAGSLDPP